jgi:hypothetical protein
MDLRIVGGYFRAEENGSDLLLWATGEMESEGDDVYGILSELYNFLHYALEQCITSLIEAV